MPYLRKTIKTVSVELYQTQVLTNCIELFNLKMLILCDFKKET